MTVKITSVNALIPLKEDHTSTQALRWHTELWKEGLIKNVYCKAFKHNDAFVVVHSRSGNDASIIKNIKGALAKA